MPEDPSNPAINVSRIKAGGGIAGAMFTVMSMSIFLIAIPALRYFLPAAIFLGGGVALAIRSIHHATPGAPWIPNSSRN